MHQMLKKFSGMPVFWVLSAMVTVVVLTIYVSVQQVYRNNANDPQVEASEEIAKLLGQNVPPEALVRSDTPVEMDKSLSLFVIIFDKDGKVVLSSGKINDTTPTPSTGNFAVLKNKSENRFTWQPQKGVRIAAVLRKLDKDAGYVLVGKNLKEIENRTRQLLMLCGVSWLILLLGAKLLVTVLSKTNTSNITLMETEVVNVQVPGEK